MGTRKADIPVFATEGYEADEVGHRKAVSEPGLKTFSGKSQGQPRFWLVKSLAGEEKG